MPPEFTSDSDLESVFSLQLPSPKKARRYSAGPKYTCSYENCKQTFKRLDHLDKHEFKHTGIRKHSCHYENCEKSYTILTHLKRHVRNTHERKNAEPIKNVPCELDTCDKRFTSLCNMYRHIREVHENPKIYQCQYCEEKFKQKMKMRRHEIQQHTGSYPFNCEKCKKGFYQEHQCKKHIESCKVYPCPTCNEIFSKWSLYLKHCKDKQHGQHGFQCEYCPRIYIASADLKNHIAAKHLNQTSQTEAGNVCGLFKCDYENCQRSYMYEKNLKQHKLTAHEGKRFKCTKENCEKVFSSKQNLQKHLKREHQINGTITEDDGSKMIKKNQNKRKRRKDAGSSRISNLSKLSGLVVDKEIDDGLRQREVDALNIVSETLVQDAIVEEILNSM